MWPIILQHLIARHCVCWVDHVCPVSPARPKNDPMWCTYCPHKGNGECLSEMHWEVYVRFGDNHYEQLGYVSHAWFWQLILNNALEITYCKVWITDKVNKQCDNVQNSNVQRGTDFHSVYQKPYTTTYDFKDLCNLDMKVGTNERTYYKIPKSNIGRWHSAQIQGS